MGVNRPPTLYLKIIYETQHFFLVCFALCLIIKATTTQHRFFSFEVSKTFLVHDDVFCIEKNIPSPLISLPLNTKKQTNQAKTKRNFGFNQKHTHMDFSCECTKFTKFTKNDQSLNFSQKGLSHGRMCGRKSGKI